MSVVRTSVIFEKIQEGMDAGFTCVSLQGSSRSSKTYNTLIWLVVYALGHANTRVSVVRATLPSIKGTVFVDFKEILINMDLFDEKALNKTEMTYHFENGSWFEFFSTDSEQKLRGRKRDVLYVNEANELKFIEWQQLKMRTTVFTVLDYNPSFSDDHWICDVNRDERTQHCITTYKDNPFLERTIIDEIESLQHKNPTLWQVYGLGLQAVVEGLIFKHYEIVERIPEGLKRRFLGMDFGFTNDPTAIVEVVFDGNDCYLDEVCYRTQMLASDIIAELKPFGKMKVISESADPRLVQEIFRAGINIHPVKKNGIMEGITKMLEYKFFITRRSTNIIKEFKNYTYKQDKEGKWLNEPVDCFNHGHDGIRYVFFSEIMGGERRPLDKQRIARAVY